MFVGLLLRLLFVLVGAKLYFGIENIFVGGDTTAWACSIQNLIDFGTYTINTNHEYGYFGRTPGYSFFIGIFYLLTGKDWNTAYQIIGWSQVFLDTIAIYFVYKIGLKIFSEDKKSAVIPAFLYATYPFIIVWNPIVYSESLSIFFLILGVYYFICEEKKYNYFFSGAFVSFSILCRPQVLPMIGLMTIVIMFHNRKNISTLFKRTAQFTLAVLIFYGSWPIRNYLNHGKIQLTHDLRGFETWTPDVISFQQYIYSVKTEWEPQFSNILNNEKVIFPIEAYLSKSDSLNLEKAIYLSKNCGSGFSQWNGYWKEPVSGQNCNEEIKSIFDKLRKNQIKHNPLNFYLILPLKNLQKALFKIKLYDTKSLSRKLASYFFIYRTLMILLGIIGVFLLFKENSSGYISLITFSYFILLYFTLCAGTSPQFRNIEMRYFLPADVLLLLCSAYPLKQIISLFKNKYSIKRLFLIR